MNLDNFKMVLLEQIFLEIQKKVQNSIYSNDKDIIKEELKPDGVYFNERSVTLNPKTSQFIDNEIIELKDLVFYEENTEEENDYKFILKKLKKIYFNNCTFLVNKLIFENQQINYDNCKFKSKHIFNPCTLLKDKETLYSNCEFFNGVFFPSQLIAINIPLFQNCEFHGVIKAENIIFNKQVFINTKENKYKLNTLSLKNCTFNDKFIIFDIDKGLYKVRLLDLTNSIFVCEKNKESKVKIQFCDIDEASFYNTKFQDLADFYQTKFKKVSFERTDFEKISVFSECEFDCDVDFKYTKFLGKAIFRDTVIKGKLDLRNTIFDDEANFLDITSKSRKFFNEKDNKEEFKGEATDIKVANRETARVIKNFFDSSNNTIEANRFYKLEMEERRKEFKNIPFFEKNDNHIFEMLIFFFHKIFSNHSQSWALVLFWIIFISFISSYLFIDNYCIVEMSVIYEKYDLIYTNLLTKYKGWLVLCLLFFTTIIMFGLIDKKWHISALFIFVIIISLLFYINLSKDYSLHYLSNLINPFSIMIGKEKLTIGLLIYKITIAYLIYQLIISIRQNTRRK